MNNPIVLAFLLADKVFREMETGKVHVAGTFNQLTSVNFPLVHPIFYVYLCMSDLKQGQINMGFEMRYLETGEQVLKVEQPIQSPGPADIIEMNLCFNNIAFRQAGSIELVLTCNGQQFASRVLHIKQANVPPIPDQPPREGGEPT